MLSAHVLAARLDPEFPQSDYSRMKELIFQISTNIEPHIIKGECREYCAEEKIKNKLEPNVWMRDILKKDIFKEMFTLERVIDMYLIKFNKIDIG